jgi:hypothetical protein
MVAETKESMMTELRNYLKVTAEVSRRCARSNGTSHELAVVSIPEFVLKHGREYEPAELADGIELGKRGECFRNAWQLVERFSDELTYVEGYAISIIPMHHAWCVDADGNAVDPTWEYDWTRQYFGVPMSSDYVRAALLRREVWGVLDPYPTHDHFEVGFDVNEMIAKESDG